MPELKNSQYTTHSDRQSRPNLPPAPKWHRLAKCRGQNPSLFFDGPKSKAKLICQGCLVSDQCRQYANQNGEQHGVWGGQDFDDEFERRQNHPSDPAIELTVAPRTPRQELVRQAARLVVTEGLTQKQASQRLGKSLHWLDTNIQRHPGEFAKMKAEVGGELQQP